LGAVTFAGELFDAAVLFCACGVATPTATASATSARSFLSIKTSWEGENCGIVARKGPETHLEIGARLEAAWSGRTLSTTDARRPTTDARRPMARGYAPLRSREVTPGRAGCRLATRSATAVICDGSTMNRERSGENSSTAVCTAFMRPWTVCTFDARR
jgi:hypothetical protein